DDDDDDDDSEDGSEDADADADADAESDFEPEDGMIPLPRDLRRGDVHRASVRERQRWERFERQMERDREEFERRQLETPSVERTPSQLVSSLQEAMAALTTPSEEYLQRSAQRASLDLPQEVVVASAHAEASEIVAGLDQLSPSENPFQAEIVEASFWMRMKRLARLSQEDDEAGVESGEPHLVAERLRVRENQRRYQEVLARSASRIAEEVDEPLGQLDPQQLYRQLCTLFPEMGLRSEGENNHSQSDDEYGSDDEEYSEGEYDSGESQNDDDDDDDDEIPQVVNEDDLD
ncbi:MAG: hypothetical protein Q8P67_21745, partial [archaeon]|nr:hypothetical protein [archaeon]